MGTRKADTVIPGDRLLPDPEILNKLRALDPNSGVWILNKMDALHQEHMERDYGTPRRSLKTIFTSEAFREGVRSAFNLSLIFRNFSTRRAPRSDYMLNRSYAYAGDRLREAIRLYMETRNVPASILTPHEQASLKPVMPPTAKAVSPAHNYI